MVTDFKVKEEAIEYFDKSNKYKGTNISTMEWSREQFNEFF